MMGVDVLAVSMIFAIPLVAIIGGIFLKALKILKGESSRGGGGSGGFSQTEAQMMQEIHRGLANLEKRVESLETLLLDRARKAQMK